MTPKHSSFFWHIYLPAGSLARFTRHEENIPTLALGVPVSGSHLFFQLHHSTCRNGVLDTTRHIKLGAHSKPSVVMLMRELCSNSTHHYSGYRHQFTNHIKPQVCMN